MESPARLFSHTQRMLLTTCPSRVIMIEIMIGLKTLMGNVQMFAFLLMWSFDYLDVSKMPSTNFPTTYWEKKEYTYWKIRNNQVGEYLLKGLQALTGNVLDPIFWEMQSYDRRYGRHAWMIILLMLRKVTDHIYILSCQRNISNMIKSTKCSWLTRLSDDEICQILGLSCVQLRIAIIILAAYFVI